MSHVAVILRLRGRVWAFGVLFVCLSLLNAALPAFPAIAKRVAAAPLDLAAMAPTAVDLEAEGLDGYTFWPAGSAGSEGDVPFQVGNWTDECCYVDSVREHLDEAGLQRSYTFALTTPDPDDDRFAARGVYGSINEFADADGAAEGLAVVDEMGDVKGATVERIDDPARIGEDTLLVSDTEVQQLTLVFQVDRLLVYVRIRDYKDEPPATALIEAVAERLLKRIEERLEGDAPGLGNHTLRLADDEYQTPFNIGSDQYNRLDGEDRPIYAESEDEYANRIAVTGDAVDAYSVGQFIQGADAAHPEFPYEMFWASTVYRFSDDEAASDWLEERTDDIESSLQRLDGVEIQDVEFVEDAQAVGDESVTVAYSEVESDDCGCINQIVRIQARSGSFVIDVYLGTRADQEIPVAAVEALAGFQFDCLASTACVEPVVLSDALAGQDLAQGPDKFHDILETVRRDEKYDVDPITSR